jgi:hypothetical protein
MPFSIRPYRRLPVQCSVEMTPRMVLIVVMAVLGWFPIALANPIEGELFDYRLLLWAIDPVEPYTFGSVPVEDFNRIAVQDTNYVTGGLRGVSRTGPGGHQDDEQEQRSLHEIVTVP